MTVICENASVDNVVKSGGRELKKAASVLEWKPGERGQGRVIGHTRQVAGLVEVREVLEFRDRC
jgi:hypothetical protein